MKTAQVSAQIASLPYDVLRIIFQWATFVPNAFDIHEPDSFAYPAPWPQEKIQAALFKSMYTNYCLALVCKAWNDVATPLLYRSICISKRKPFMALLRSMQVTLTEDHNRSADMAKSSSKGKWTRRLDILYRDKTVLHASSFARFLKCLPNLQIIVQRGTFLMLKRSDFHLSIFVVLPALVSQSLHVLDVKCSYDYDSTNGHNHPNAARITDAVGNQPLHTLKVCPVAAGRTHKQHAFLSSIECLDTSQHFINPILSDICLAPKLKRISLNAGYGDGPGPYSKCLAQITSGIGQLEIDTTTSDPGHALSLHDVANLFPNLHNLVVTLDVLTPHVLSEYLPPVVNLGIHTTTLWQ
ncbi:uncharacterized protein FOMMEDRAFT_166482 [Fomitiporia mediterranea MF3/22]|uniref:uncharacterized protein n=1 Tax=Fomitiporia mediterranea (strain MF3/22) TaxID=694068 RepID=UPI0004407580|nr:uncharacterized protein FOMMEDRAFT_166482 [Fomitiporia mediterranea MF3/22]EJD06241.1 hypothetical protein FOMMEDRAFT_166482 [Fomitiporia mediterranea MF3/22]